MVMFMVQVVATKALFNPLANIPFLLVKLKLDHIDDAIRLYHAVDSANVGFNFYVYYHSKQFKYGKENRLIIFSWSMVMS